MRPLKKQGGDYRQFIEKAKDKNDPFRLMGFGHRVYKTFDPRALILKDMAHKLFEDLKCADPLLDLALELEAAALEGRVFRGPEFVPQRGFLQRLHPEGPSAFPRTCSPSCSPSAVCRDGSPSGGKA